MKSIARHRPPLFTMPASATRRRSAVKGFAFAAFWLSILVANPCHGALFVTFQGSTTVSPTSPSLTLSVQNTGASDLSIGGLNFFVTEGGGTAGPTMDTTVPTSPNPALGVNLLTGTLFNGNGLGQFTIGSPQARSQGWGVLSFPAVTLTAGTTAKLAILTFNTFPDGIYALDFSGTSFADGLGGTIGSVTLPSGNLTSVPEPTHYGLAVGVALLLATRLSRRFEKRP